MQFDTVPVLTRAIPSHRADVGSAAAAAAGQASSSPAHTLYAPTLSGLLTFDTVLSMFNVNAIFSHLILTLGLRSVADNKALSLGLEVSVSNRAVEMGFKKPQS